MKTAYETEVLAGGFLFMRLTPAEMIFRKEHFKFRGNPAPHLLSNLHPNDGIQYCLETGELLASRNNTDYSYVILGDERLDIINELKKTVVRPSA
jgi:hypothetical protein